MKEQIKHMFYENAAHVKKKNKIPMFHDNAAQVRNEHGLRKYILSLQRQLSDCSYLYNKYVAVKMKKKKKQQKKKQM